MPSQLRTISTRQTPQSERARVEEVRNNAGGYVFKLDPMSTARRFLILGSDGGTAYQNARDLSAENAQAIIALANDHTLGLQLVDLIEEVSTRNLAARQDPTLFSLAICAASPRPEVRRRALDAAMRVCRTGDMFFLFQGYCSQFRGRGQALNNFTRRWYLEQPVDDLAFQCVKYRQRARVGRLEPSHYNLLRLAKPKPASDDIARRNLFAWLTSHPVDEVPRIVEGFMKAQAATAPRDWANIVREYRLPWEALPTEALKEREVWEALFPFMGLTAVMRNLNRFAILDMGREFHRDVVRRLTDAEKITSTMRGNYGVHPFNVLNALATYSQGHGFRGGQTWTPVRNVIDALDAMFYLAFGTVEPTGKRVMLAVDCSGSMSSQIMNSAIACRDAAATMAMVTARVESDWLCVGFTGGGSSFNYRRNTLITELSISPRQRLDDVRRTMSRADWGSTDCALPILYATQRKLSFDLFTVYTDNETWEGNIHVDQALREYRQRTGIPARIAVIGMTATPYTIGDPSDPGTLNLVGFDSSAPHALSLFARGEL